LDSLFKDVFAGNRWGVLCGLALDRCASLAQELVADFVLVDELRNLDQVMALEANTNPVLVLDAYHKQDTEEVAGLCKQWLMKFPQKQLVFLFSKSIHHFELPDVYGRGRWIDCDTDAALPNTKGADDSRLRRFARKVEPKYGTEQLVLGPVTAAKFREALDFMRTKEFCEEEWGFKEKHSRGHGITVLFHGESGTGKTMAAEVIAHTLKRPLYQIDLSSVFSKWVGETEKNLRAVFEAASGVNGVLLFDEGDALFGARSSGGGSAQDRYGNLEVNFLLQELEAFNGISVISTNHFKNLDSAFLRRFSFSITFQQPTPELREKIWRANVPAKMPLAENVDFKHLSLFAMSGGSVRNCIREAAATAAAKKASEVTHEDFLRAIKRECQKFEREFPRELVGEVYWRKVSPEWELSPVKRLPRV
jgi:hypothetical protein